MVYACALAACRQYLSSIRQADATQRAIIGFAGNGWVGTDKVLVTVEPIGDESLVRVEMAPYGINGFAEIGATRRRFDRLLGLIDDRVQAEILAHRRW